MYEVGQVKIEAKRRRGDLILAIYGDLRHAERWCENYNQNLAVLGLKASIWSYFGSKPHQEITNGTPDRAKADD